MLQRDPRTFRAFKSLMLLGAPLAFSSCAALYFLGGGKGTQEALYVLPKGKRVLVFVDAPASVELPPNYGQALGQKISDHLYKYNATDTLVAQSRLSALRNDPTFAKMGIADVARETGADLVIYVNVVALSTPTSTDKAVAQGDAQAMVKVVDSSGTRVYPATDVAGTPVQAHLEPALVEGRPEGTVMAELNDLLAVRTGRMFHKYNLEDADVTK